MLFSVVTEGSRAISIADQMDFSASLFGIVRTLVETHKLLSAAYKRRGGFVP